jgi:hypothetical protein
MALQLFMQSFGLLNQFLPSFSILDKGLPIWHFQLLYIFSNIILPAYLVLVLVLLKIVVAVMKTVMNTIDKAYVILLLQFRKLLIGGGIVQDVW